MAQVVQRQGALHRLLDALALLDMLTGLARFVAAAPGTYVRPRLSATGALCHSGQGDTLRLSVFGLSSKCWPSTIQLIAAVPCTCRRPGLSASGVCLCVEDL